MKESKEMHYAFMNAIKMMSQNIHVEESGRVIINCGQNNIYIDNEDDESAVKSSTKIVKEAFFNGINIKQDERNLSTIPLSIYGDGGKSRSGDMDCQNLYEFASKTWETYSKNEVNLAEEIKSRVTLDMIPGLDKQLNALSFASQELPRARNQAPKVSKSAFAALDTDSDEEEDEAPASSDGHIPPLFQTIAGLAHRLGSHDQRTWGDPALLR